jgi:hypothetical protein
MPLPPINELAACNMVRIKADEVNGKMPGLKWASAKQGRINLFTVN